MVNDVLVGLFLFFIGVSVFAESSYLYPPKCALADSHSPNHPLDEEVKAQ